MIERRENVRYIDGQPFRDTPERVTPPVREPRVPEWVRRAKLAQLPAKPVAW